MAEIQQVSMRVRFQDISQPAQKAVLAIFNKAPNKLLVVRRSEGHEHRIGFDGKIGWEQDDGARPTLLLGDRLEPIREAADFYEVLNRHDHYENITYDHFENANGKKAHVLKFIPYRGAVCYHHYDADSFLDLEIECLASAGKGVSVNRFSDYREVDGVWIPFHQSAEGSQHILGELTNGDGASGELQVTDVQVNPELDDSIFSLPSVPSPKK